MLQCSVSITDGYYWNAPLSGHVVYEGCNTGGWCKDELCDWYTKNDEGYPQCWVGGIFLPQ